MTHLQEYLSFYMTTNAPGYAVLVTGAWGTGKSHQVKACIPEASRIYVSLYGLQSVDQIHAEVFAAANSIKNRTKKFLDGFKGKEVGAFGFQVPLDAIPAVGNAIIKNSINPDRVLIFDDLERCQIDITEALGAINNYVEHKDFRVVVIAHENDRLKEKNFLEVKEKVFGQTIHVEPMVDDAFKKFVSLLRRDDAKKFVSSNQSLIRGVFLDSKIGSLRILHHVVEDLERLYSCLDRKHLANSEAMAEAIGMFAAMSAEYRAGNLESSNFRNRRGAKLAHYLRSGSKEERPDPPNLVRAAAKYPKVNLESELLNDQVLISMICDGRFSAAEIRSSLDNSPHFIEAQAVDPWKIVIHFDDLDDHTVAEAVKKMNTQFANREIINFGELMHIFCLRIMMAEQGISDLDVDTAFEENKSYIDDVLEKGALPPRGNEWDWQRQFDRSYDGLGYWFNDETHKFFVETRKYLVAASEEAFRRKLPDISADLLRIVQEKPNQFFEDVSPTNNGPNKYAYVAVLHQIPPKAFVEAWLGGHESQWRHITMALDNRYSGGGFVDRLAPEAPWALEVLKELDAKAQSSSGFRKFRIERIRPKALVEYSAEVRNEVEDAQN